MLGVQIKNEPQILSKILFAKNKKRRPNISNQLLRICKGRKMGDQSLLARPISNWSRITGLIRLKNLKKSRQDSN